MTVAPGVTLFTTIERFGKPPFSVTESDAISGACGFTFTVTGTFCLTLTIVESAGSSTSTSLVKTPTSVSDGAPPTQLKLVFAALKSGLPDTFVTASLGFAAACL